MKSFCVDELKVYACENRTIMGELAAKDISAKIKELLAKKSEINFRGGSVAERRIKIARRG